MASDNPEIHTEEIALFSRPPVNVAEDRISWHEIRPSYMSNAEYSSINFSIIGNSSQYVKLSDTELYGTNSYSEGRWNSLQCHW